MSKKNDTKKTSLQEALDISTNDLFFPTLPQSAIEHKPEEIITHEIEAKTNEDIIQQDDHLELHTLENDHHAIKQTTSKHDFFSNKKKEIKIKRVSVVMTPSLYDKLIKFTESHDNCSMNEVIVYALQEFLSE